MAKARKGARKRKAATRRKKGSVGSLDKRVKAAVAQLQKTFGVAKIVGTVKNGKLRLETGCDDIEVRFIALNAPFKTKALVSAA